MFSRLIDFREPVLGWLVTVESASSLESVTHHLYDVDMTLLLPSFEC